MCRNHRLVFATWFLHPTTVGEAPRVIGFFLSRISKIIKSHVFSPYEKPMLIREKGRLVQNSWKTDSNN